MKRGILFSNVLLASICIALLAVSAQAQVQWAKRIASATTLPSGEPDVGMCLDTNGNCYVTGFYDGTNDFGGVILTNKSVGGSDIFVAKYNTNGALQWAQRAGGSSPNLNNGRGIGVDTNGNVYVAGGFYGPADFGSSNLPATQNEEFFLAKYNSAGTVQWVQQSVGGNADGEDDVYGTGLAVDGAGNCYAVGVANNGATITFGTTNLLNANTGDYSTFLVKYDNTGTVKWAQLMGGSGWAYACKVAVDTNGNVYVSGCFYGYIEIGTSMVLSSPGSTKNMFLAKFNSSGVLTWVQQPTGGDPDGDGGLAVDQAGNVYVPNFIDSPINFGSISLTNTATYDAFVAKYNSSGVIQWARMAGGTNLGVYNAYLDNALDSAGNVYAGGALSSAAGGNNGSPVAVIAKYSPAGTLQWAYTASGPPASPVSSMVVKCAVDSSNNCFLAGWYQPTNTFGTNVLQPLETWNYFLAKVAAPAPPTLGIVLSNGVPQLSLAGAISSIFSLQYSPTLAATNTPWQTLTTLALTNSPQLYLDTSAPSGTNRFYRAGPPAL
jgi:hypothetical protein